MKKMKFNLLAARSVTAGLFVGALMASPGAFACTVANWSNSSGSPLASGPAGPDGKSVIARYSGLCAMQTADGAVSFVEDTNPGGIDRIRARFYVLANNSEDAQIYEGLNGTTSVFTVQLGADGAVSLSGDGLSQPLAANGVSGKWNSIELDWNAGAGQLDLWVNSDAASEPADAGSSFNSGQVVTAVRLGNLDGAAGTLGFDAYESRRMTAVGRLLLGDANGSGAISAADVVSARLEFLGTPQTGQPDCNESGSITAADVVCTRNVFLSSP